MSLVCSDLKLCSVGGGFLHSKDTSIQTYVVFLCWYCRKMIRQGWIWSLLTLYVPLLNWCECLNSGMDPAEMWIRWLPAATTYLPGKVSPPLLPLVKFHSIVCAPFHLHKGSHGHFWDLAKVIKVYVGKNLQSLKFPLGFGFFCVCFFCVCVVGFFSVQYKPKKFPDLFSVNKFLVMLKKLTKLRVLRFCCQPSDFSIAAVSCLWAK